MNWRYPEILIVVLALGVIVFFLGVFQQRKMRLLSGTKREIRAEMLKGYDFSQLNRKNRLIFWGLLFLAVAAAGPQIGVRVKPVERKGADLVFAIDISASMNAEDVIPSRLEKAKYEIGQIIRNLQGDRVAFIVFAGSSHLYLPLTSDYEAALLFLNAIDTDMIPTQGTSLAAALNTGIAAFSNDSEKYKVLILVTDGEDHEGEAIEIAKKAADLGFTIHTIGVGTVAGSLIPVQKADQPRSEYKKDSQGRLVTSTLNETLIRDIARAGNGMYLRFDNQQASHRDILKTLDQMEKRTISTHEFSDFEDRYHLFGTLAFVLLSLGYMLPNRSPEKRGLSK